LEYDSIEVDPKEQRNNTLMGCLLYVDVAWFYTYEDLPQVIKPRVSVSERENGVFFCDDTPQRFVLRMDDGTITRAGSDADIFRRKVKVHRVTEGTFQSVGQPSKDGLTFACAHAFREKPEVWYRNFSDADHQKRHADLYTVPIELQEGRMLALRLFADGLQVHTTRSFSMGKVLEPAIQYA